MLRVPLVTCSTDWRVGIDNILVKMSASVTVVLFYCCSEGIFLGCFCAVWFLGLAVCQKPPVGQDTLLSSCAGVLCLVTWQCTAVPVMPGTAILA